MLKNNLKAIRTQNSLSQEALAESVGVSRQTIISLEKNVYKPSVLLALKLSSMLGVSVEKLFYIE
jgi:putative transcriptional regulator